MKMKNKRKGFTLTELLVAIVIIGIVTGLSLPIIQNVKLVMERKKYTSYQDGTIHSAKLYVDSYSEDLFGNLESGCAIVKYSDLANKKLIEDIEMEDVSCATDETKIRILKSNGKYFYTPSVTCGTVGNDGHIVDKKYSSNIDLNEAECKKNFYNPITVSVDPPKYEGNDKKKIKMNVTLSSLTGINQGLVLYYLFRDESGNVVSGDWKPVVFKLPSESKQRNQIERNYGTKIAVSSDEITTPDNLTNKLKLEIKVDRLNDLAGRDWKKPEESNLLSFNPYIVDNSKPIVASYNVRSDNNSYNSLTPYLNINANDKNNTSEDKFSKIEDLRVCYYYDNDVNKCSFEKRKLKDANHLLYNPSIHMQNVPTTSGNYDGSTHKVHAFVFDNANNRTDLPEINYRVAARIIYKPGDGTGSMSDSICNVGANCTISNNLFTYTGHTFTGWNTKADGSGTSYSQRQVIQLQGNVTLYAQWRLNVCSINFNANGGTFNSHANDTLQTMNYGTSTSGTVRNANGGYYNATRYGYHIDASSAWISSYNSHTFNEDADYRAIDFCPNLANSDQSVTLNVNWHPNSCTITYNSNGGTFNSHSNSLSETMYYNDRTNDTMRNLNGGYYNASRIGYHIDSGSAWISSYNNGTFNENSYYYATDICPNLGNSNQSVTLKANWKQNICTITYSPGSGGWFTSNANDTVQTFNYFDSGTPDMRNCNGGYYSAKKTGYHLDSANSWISSNNKIFNQDNGYTPTAFCPNLATRSESITLYPNWQVNVCKVTFNANGGTFNSHANDTVQTFNYTDGSSNMRNANGGYYNATKTYYKITASTAWNRTSDDKKFSENSDYGPTDYCPDLANGNQNVTMKVNWQKNDPPSCSMSVSLDNEQFIIKMSTSSNADIGSKGMGEATANKKFTNDKTSYKVSYDNLDDENDNSISVYGSVTDKLGQTSYCHTNLTIRSIYNWIWKTNDCDHKKREYYIHKHQCICVGAGSSCIGAYFNKYNAFGSHDGWMHWKDKDSCDKKDVSKVTNMECGNFTTKGNFHGIQFGSKGTLTLIGKNENIWAAGNKLYNKNESDGKKVCSNICKTKYNGNSCNNTGSFNESF